MSRNSQFPGGADQKIGTIETVKIGNQAIKFFMKNRGVVYAGKKPVNRINNQTACPQRFYLFSQPDDGLINLHTGKRFVYNFYHVLFLKGAQIPVESQGVGDQLRGGFLHRQKNSLLPVIHGALGQELQTQHRFAGP
jgi:hypothetical protein